MDVKALCLGVLTYGDRTGYDIKKYFEDGFRHFSTAGFGSIYPALADLTRAGLVQCTDVAQDKRPDKKVYSITEAGRRTLRSELTRTSPQHRIRSDFFVLLCFAHLLPRDVLAQKLDQRISDIEAMIAHVTKCRHGECDAPSHEFVLDLSRESLEAQLNYIRKNYDRILATAAPVPDLAKSA
jgi:PadR family transcriptional regulator AphA